MARDTIRIRVEVNRETLEWFNEAYPDSSVSAVVSMLFDKLREVTEITPSQYAVIAAKALKEEVKT